MEQNNTQTLSRSLIDIFKGIYLIIFGLGTFLFAILFCIALLFPGCFNNDKQNKEIGEKKCIEAVHDIGFYSKYLQSSLPDHPTNNIFTGYVAIFNNDYKRTISWTCQYNTKLDVALVIRD